MNSTRVHFQLDRARGWYRPQSRRYGPLELGKTRLLVRPVPVLDEETRRVNEVPFVKSQRLASPVITFSTISNENYNRNNPTKLKNQHTTYSLAAFGRRGLGKAHALKPTRSRTSTSR